MKYLMYKTVRFFSTFFTKLSNSSLEVDIVEVLKTQTNPQESNTQDVPSRKGGILRSKHLHIKGQRITN